ncbi:LysM peptidoglycan-binding domain-containing protein [Dietzia cercidiphylli]|uniref:LysM peptidoglycan-binding domain-containing protein n=1 Tax=Dietzia cercidiphylli TaxID=498199 RepID=UPI00223B3578|nr:LysM peptidoglycan-binding domain-containing protein [Dietzia cercidiphylli]MCT1517141.1 LysM peptidoglycan-binding domain-containing protein [Dietzia cercidiphylli]
MATRIVRGLASLALLLALLVGAPIALWTLGGTPWPDHVPGMTELMLGGWTELLLSLLKLIGWAAWALLAYAVIVETISLARGITITPPPGLSVAHGSARSLVLGVFLLGSLGSTATAVAAPGDAPGPAQSGQDPAPTVGSADATATSPRAQAPAEATLPAYDSTPNTVTTVAGDTLWSLAEQHYGDGQQWTQIRDANPELASSPLLAIGQQIVIPPAPAQDGQYTVQPGDCLWDIAATMLGDGHRWTEIRDANPAAVHGASSIIHVGTHLSMPDHTATPAPSDPAPTPSVPAPSASEPVQDDLAPQPGDDAPASPPPPTETATPPEVSDPAPDPATSSPAPAPVEEADPSEDEELSRDFGSADAGQADNSQPASPPVTSSPAESAAPAPAGDPAQEAEDKVAEILGGTAPTTDTGSAPAEVDDPAPTDEPTPTADASQSPTTPTAEPAPTDEPAPAPAPAEETNPDEDEELSRDLGSADAGQADDSQPASPPVTSSPAESAAPAPAGDPAQEAEDKVADILGPFSATQQGDPAPPQQDAPTSSAPAAAQPDAPTSSAPVAGIGNTSVAPQPEASGHAVEDIERQAAAAAAGMLAPAPQGEPPAPPPPPPPPTPADKAPHTIAGVELTAASLQNPRGIGVVAGLSALALLGIVGSVAWRRRRQQHDRGRGQSIALPAEHADGVLDAMDAAADPVILDDVAVVLRHLAAQTSSDGSELPTLVGVTLGEEQVAVALVDEVDLPEPWEMREGSWWVQPSALDGADETTVSPWPTVVPIGAIDGEDFLLNLELVGHLAIRAADPARARHIVQALAVELAVSPLTEEVQLHLVGVAADLPDAVGCGRIQVVDSIDELIADMEATSKRHERDLADDGIATIAEARAVYQSYDYTAPHVVLSVDSLTAEQRRRIDALAAGPRWAFAAVTPAENTGAGWILDVDDDGHAELHTGAGDGMEMEVKGLDDEALAAVVEVLASTNRPATEPSLAAPVSPVATDTGQALGDMGGFLPSPEPDVAADEPPAEQDPAAESAAQGPGWAAEQVDSSLIEDTQPMPVLVPAPTPQPVTEEPVTEAAVVEEVLAEAGHLWIRTLGVPQIDPVTPGRLEANKVGLLTELAVMLHLTGGADHRRIDARLWPKDQLAKISEVSARRKKMNARRQQALSRLRAWMGPASDGEDALPKVGDRSGNAVFRLHPEITSDWQLFQRLLPDPTDLGAVSDQALAAAVSLVTGPPLTAPRMATRYGWADDERQEMISRSADAIEELAARQICDHKVAEALATAEFGLTVDQGREGLWRLAIICTHALGEDDSRQRTQELIDRMLAHMTDLEVDLEEETDTLLASLTKLSDDDGQRLYDITAQAS